VSTIDPETDEVKFDEVSDIAPEKPKHRGRTAYPRDPVTGEIIRPDGSKGRTPGRPRTKISLEAQLDGFVTLVNTLVIAFKPLYALDQIEKVALVKALDQQCQTSPRFRKYIEKFLQGAGGVNLLGVVAIIAVRRVARTGAIPLPVDSPISAQDIDNMAGGLLFAMTTGTPNAVPTSIPTGN
jgi:hypothetical protein